MSTARKKVNIAIFMAWVFGTACAFSLTDAARAADVAVRHFEIKAQALSSALRIYADRTGEQVVFFSDSAKGLKSSEVMGDYTGEEALQKLLANTGLVAERSSSGTIMIRPTDVATSMNGADSVVLRLAQADGAQSAKDAGAAGQDGLDEVVVQGAKRKFAPTDSSAATKIPMDIIDTPQSMSVLSSELIDITGARTVNQIAALAPGVADNNPDIGAYSTPIGRGFYQFDGNSGKINGMPYGENGVVIDAGVIDRVEVVRGPAAVIYGQANYGVTVNTELKKPQAKAGFIGSLGGSIDGAYRVMADVTGPLTDSGSVRGRLVSVYDNYETSQDLAYQRTATVAPSLSWDITESLQFDGFLMHSDRQFRNTQGFSGVTVDNTIPDIPRSAFNAPDWAISKAKTDLGIIKLTYDFGSSWMLAATSLIEETNLDWHGPYACCKVPASGEVTLYDFNYLSEQRDEAYDLTLTGNFQAFHETQTLVLNGYYRRAPNPAMYSRCSIDGTPIGSINVYDSNPYSYTDPCPDIPTKVGVLTPDVSTAFAPDVLTHEKAFSMLLLLHPANRLSALLGTRYTEFDMTQTSTFDPGVSYITPDLYKKDGITSRAGLVYEAAAGVNVYGSYSMGLVFRPGLTSSGDALAPETGVQYEVGAKAALLDKRLTVAAALFQIERKDVAAADPTQPPGSPYSVLIGGQTHKGLELETIGEPIPGWNILANYSYLDVSITDSPDPSKIGHRPDSVPKSMLKLYTTYQLQEGGLRGVSVGGGVFHVGDREVDDTGTARLPAYTRVDLRLAYDALKNTSYSLNVINVGNEKIYASGSGAAILGIDYVQRRSVLFQVNVKY